MLLKSVCMQINVQDIKQFKFSDSLNYLNDVSVYVR